MEHIQSEAGWITDKIHNLPIEFVDGDRSNKYPKRDEFVSEGIPFLNAMSINQGYLELSKANFITAEKFATIKKGRLQQGDLILTTRGNGVGNAAYFSGKTKTGLINAQLLILRPKPERISPRFLYYLFISPYVQDLIRNFVSGSAQPQLPIQSIRNIELSYPPLPTQRKIAAILSAYDDLIENNTRRIKILEEMAQALYREWFVNFRFPGHEKVRMEDSELGPKPEGWVNCSFSDICSKITDGTHDTPEPTTNGYFLVTGKNIIDGFVDFTKCYCISPEEHEQVMKRSRPEKFDIIFSNIGTLGSTALVDQDFEYSIKNVALFKPMKRIYSNFIFLHLYSSETLKSMTQSASGTSQKFFSLGFLRKSKILVPNEDLLLIFDEIVRPIIEQRSILNKKNLNLRRTRDFLLPKLISGEIDVESLEIKEGGLGA